METSEPVVVIAHWQTADAALGAVLDHVASLRPLSLAEPGCLGYEVLQNAEDPRSLVLIERYRDEIAHREHLNSSHYQEFVVDRIRPLLAGRHVEILRAREVT